MGLLLEGRRPRSEIPAGSSPGSTGRENIRPSPRPSHHSRPGSAYPRCFNSLDAPRDRFAVDSPLEEAVSSELVSISNSLLSWEKTGKFINFASGIRVSHRKRFLGSVPYGGIPYATEQATNCALAGN